MNVLSTTLLAAAIAFAGTTQLHAADKIGMVNVEGVFQSLPQSAAIQARIAAEFKEGMEDVQRLEKELQYQMEVLSRDGPTMSRDASKQLEDKISVLRENYTAKARPLQRDMQRRLVDERNKILAEIATQVAAIAAEENYDVILNAGAIVFADDSRDISKKVIDRMK